MSINALILAGSRGETDRLAASDGVSHKALIAIDGETLLQRVYSALAQAGIDRILVSASDRAVTAAAEALGAEVINPDAGPSGSVARALARTGTPLLVTTADHGLLRAEWVRQFLADAPPHADVAILLAERAAVEKAAPGTSRTWLKFADGDWSGCNLFLLAGEGAQQAIALWSGVEADRKRPWRLVARLGPGMLAAYALGRLTLFAGVRRLGKRNGIRAEAVAARDGAAAIDVDKPADLALVRAMVAARQP